MKLLLFNCILVLSHIGQAQTLRYEGILNDTAIDPDFDKGHEAISISIKENLAHLNLYEYAHALPELYPLVENGVIEAQQWKYFVDSLEREVKKHQNDSIVPYWAVDYTGLIPYQSQFFIATIDRNIKLNEKYPKAYKILKANTSSMDGLGYKREHFDSLLVFSEVVGETNFWFFFQLEDCRFVSEVIKNNEEYISWFRAVAQSMELTSTYKVPLYLQIRKWNALQRRITESDDALCKEGYKPLEKISIRIEDKNRNYYSDALRDGIDRNKTKKF